MHCASLSCTNTSSDAVGPKHPCRANFCDSGTPKISQFDAELIEIQATLSEVHPDVTVCVYP